MIKRNIREKTLPIKVDTPNITITGIS